MEWRPSHRGWLQHCTTQRGVTRSRAGVTNKAGGGGETGLKRGGKGRSWKKARKRPSGGDDFPARALGNDEPWGVGADATCSLTLTLLLPRPRSHSHAAAAAAAGKSDPKLPRASASSLVVVLGRAGQGRRALIGVGGETEARGVAGPAGRHVHVQQQHQPKGIDLFVRVAE